MMRRRNPKKKRIFSPEELAFNRSCVDLLSFVTFGERFSDTSRIHNYAPTYQPNRETVLGVYKNRNITPRPLFKFNKPTAAVTITDSAQQPLFQWKLFIKPPLVDDVKLAPEDIIFKHSKGAIILPVSKYFGVTDNQQFDYFSLTSKRCYNNDNMREHICKYLNYFEKYYDTDHELAAVYAQIKYLIDCEESYTGEAFIYDIKRYIINSRIGTLLHEMNSDNYILNLEYHNNKNPGLQYTNDHGRILMEMSLFQNVIIPLVTHFISVKKVKAVKHFLLTTFQLIFDQYEDTVDMINKLYETTLSTVIKNADTHKSLWDMQNIRAKNTTTHSIQTVVNIVLQIMPKYTYNNNIIHFNYKSVVKSNDYQVVDIGYEYNFKQVSSSKRDEDNNSELDKHEIHLIKSDEAIYIHNKVNSEDTMAIIEQKYGPFSEREIEFYERELTKDGRPLINEFQKNLVLYPFYKQFGDVRSANSINSHDYIKLILAAKQILLANGMVILPYIISGKITRFVNRVAINKKELTKIEASPFFSLVEEKYHNPKIVKNIYAMIAALLSSKFQFIDFKSQLEYEAKTQFINGLFRFGLTAEELDRDNLNGKPIDIIPELICEEVLQYVAMI